MTNLANLPPLGLKQSRVMKDPARLDAVAQLPCVICGARPVECHHCISGRYGQRKAPDSMAIPLCVACHRGPQGIHASKRAWEELHGPDTGFLDLVERMLTGQALGKYPPA